FNLARLFFGRDVDVDGGVHVAVQAHADLMFANLPEGLGQLDLAAVYFDAEFLLQGVGDVLAGDRAKQAALLADLGLEVQRGRVHSLRERARVGRLPLIALGVRLRHDFDVTHGAFGG